MFFDGFSSNQILPLYIAIPILLLSIFLFTEKEKLSLFLLFIGGLFLGYFMANLNPFFGVWDEQFHAMVAKNLSFNMLEPKLYADAPIPYDWKNWTQNEIWLHKQPLFLWQMALSIKIFGYNVFAVRLPSIIMHAVLPILIYRIGAISINKQVGFYAAFIILFLRIPLELIVGAFHTDHNDLAFLFYLTASFWAWFEYKNSNNKIWLIAIGVLSGCAVLNKWLMGLLIYVIWLITTLVSDENKKSIKTYIPLVISGLISLIISIPWQIYIFYKYPLIAAHEFEYNARHFSEVIEGHGGSLFYHFDEAFRLIYGAGTLIPIFVIIGLITLIIKIERFEYKFAILSTIIFIYTFFTIAKTKMPLFTLIASPFIILGYGALLDTLFKFLKEKIKNKFTYSSLKYVIFIWIIFACFDLTNIEQTHTKKDPAGAEGWEKYVKNTEFINHIDSLNLSKEHIIFGAEISYRGDIQLMFQTGITSYYFIPEEEIIKELLNKGRKPVFIDLGKLPNYINKYQKDILIIKPF